MSIKDAFLTVTPKHRKVAWLTYLYTTLATVVVFVYIIFVNGSCFLNFLLFGMPFIYQGHLDFNDDAETIQSCTEPVSVTLAEILMFMSLASFIVAIFFSIRLRSQAKKQTPKG